MPSLRLIRLLLLTVTVLPALGYGAASPDAGAARSRVRHVFVIVLENQGYQSTFGPQSKAPYLAHELPLQGVLLPQYFGTAHFSLGNYIAMISGQAGTQQTRDDCETFADYALQGVTPDGQAIGHGCVYPASIKTVADQIGATRLTWRGYMEDLGNDASREAATCGNPKLDAADPTQAAEEPSVRVPLGDQYAARHNPFVYFHSLVDSKACARNVVNFRRLEHDLRTAKSTPNFAFITPNLCHDGHDAPCKNGEPGGLVSADAFLRKWVPKILASPAYRHDGLLVITFDEGETPETPGPAGGHIINAAGETCCNQLPGPNLGSFPQHYRDGDYLENFESFGGDRTGAVLLSPFLRGGAVSKTAFNHYSLLKTVEDVLGLEGHLGYAAQPGLVGFFEAPGSDVVLQAREH